MIVSCEGAPLHEFDFEGAYELWLKEKHRRILDVDRKMCFTLFLTVISF